MRPNTPDYLNPGLERTRYQLRAANLGNKAANPLRSGIHSRGYLPHVKRENASYFVTFRLADSLPKEVLMNFERERAARLRRLFEFKNQGKTVDDSEADIQRDFRRSLERFLDRGAGACPLKDERIAGLVVKALLYFQESRYLLGDWVIMPNHVHAILWPKPDQLLSDILKSWKQFTSRRAKAILDWGDSPFWQRESYDHWIRSDEERSRIAGYIRRNPVTAGLCASPEEWPWSSAHRPSF